MDPFRTCPHCEQSVRIVYQDDTNKNALVFEVHTEKDYVTRCLGSRKLVNLASSTPAPEVPSTTPVEPSLVVQPDVSKTLQLQVVACPECNKDTRTKLNLRGTLVFIEHYNTAGRRCTHSLKPTLESK